MEILLKSLAIVLLILALLIVDKHNDNLKD